MSITQRHTGNDPVVRFRITDEMKASIDALAEMENRSRANMIEVLLAEALSRRVKPPALTKLKRA